MPNEDGVNTQTAFRDLASISRICRKILGRNYDFETVASEIWLDGWTKIGSPADQHEIQVSWKYISHRCFDHIRRNRRDKEIELIFDQMRGSFKTLVEDNYLNKIFDKARLSAKQEEIIGRKFFLKQTIEEIQSEMRLTREAFQTLYTQAIELLKQAARSLHEHDKD